MFIALYAGPLTMASLPEKESSANQRTEKSTFVYEYAINTNPRPCENERINPIPWEDEKKISAGFQKANTGYIESEIVIFVR